MILVRTTRPTAMVDALADMLGATSGEPVALLVDERRGDAGASRHPKVSLTDQACRRLGLHTPGDFAWRCGDYGFYLAQEQFPQDAWFWMIEYDVRIAGDAAQFFAACARHGEVDLLAAHVRPAEPDWWWYRTVAARDAQPYRCFFPVVRLSARAVRRLHDKRRAQSRRPLRRALWPNDESFVATAAVHAGLGVADFNDFGPRFYDDATYAYDRLIDGETFAAEGEGPQLYHPVLFGDDYRRKLERTQADAVPVPLIERAYRKLVAKLNGTTRW